ncbi:hypothetical protein BDW62DRAFT_153502 [Aspergillus aurantiobrunneus]
MQQTFGTFTPWVSAPVFIYSSYCILCQPSIRFLDRLPVPTVSIRPRFHPLFARLSAQSSSDLSTILEQFVRCGFSYILNYEFMWKAAISTLKRFLLWLYLCLSPPVVPVIRIFRLGS